MQVGDLVKIWYGGDESYKGQLGLVIEKTKSAWMERLLIKWFDGRNHWHDPRNLEVIK
tara:strand:- start:30 stop:203 length:174 start_codon:yes stop_codon:yes gene_type:complete